MWIDCATVFGTWIHHNEWFSNSNNNIYYQTDDKAEDSTQEVKPEDDKKETKGNAVKGGADNG